MANRLARLLGSRRRPGADPSPGAGPAVDGAAMALDAAAMEPAPVLLPAAIFRQVLFDPSEFTPVWLRPRPAFEPAPSSPSRPPLADAPVAAAAPVEADASVASAAQVEADAPIEEPKPAKRTRRTKVTGSPAPSRPRSKRAAKSDQGATDR